MTWWVLLKFPLYFGWLLVYRLLKDCCFGFDLHQFDFGQTVPALQVDIWRVVFVEHNHLFVRPGAFAAFDIVHGELITAYGFHGCGA